MRNPYENSALLDADSGSMHPGGLRLTSRAARLAALAPGMKLLDIGCGGGATLGYLQEKYGVEPFGIDSSEELITRARARYPELNLTAGDAKSLPFAGAGFDAVLSECSFSVIGDYPRLLRESFRVLKDGAALIVSDICPKTGLEKMRASFCGAGFQIRFFEEHMPALVTYARELERAGIDARRLCGGMRETTYFLIICEKSG